MDDPFEVRGIRTASHATSQNNIVRIYLSNELRAGSGELFDAERHFADSPWITQGKSIHGKGRWAIIIIASVDFDTDLVRRALDSDMWETKHRANGGNAVKGCSSPEHEWEYAAR
jgi:hypothetical protein